MTEWGIEREVLSVSAALLGDDAYLLGTDVTAFMRAMALQVLEDAHAYVDEGEREAALALGEVAIQMTREADQMDLALMEIQQPFAEPGVTSG